MTRALLLNRSSRRHRHRARCSFEIPAYICARYMRLRVLRRAHCRTVLVTNHASFKVSNSLAVPLPVACCLCTSAYSARFTLTSSRSGCQPAARTQLSDLSDQPFSKKTSMNATSNLHEARWFSALFASTAVRARASASALQRQNTRQDNNLRIAPVIVYECYCVRVSLCTTHVAMENGRGVQRCRLSSDSVSR